MEYLMARGDRRMGGGRGVLRSEKYVRMRILESVNLKAQSVQITNWARMGSILRCCGLHLLAARAPGSCPPPDSAILSPALSLRSAHNGSAWNPAGQGRRDGLCTRSPGPRLTFPFQEFHLEDAQATGVPGSDGALPTIRVPALEVGIQLPV